jgi:hypothetical protein
MELHDQMALMHNMMIQQAESMITTMNSMIGALPQIPHARPHTAHVPHHHHHHSNGFTHFPPLRSQDDLSYENLMRLEDTVKKRGVATADLRKLKKTQFSSRDVCKQCGICQDNFAVGTKIIMLPCKHSYCEKEILHWFEQNKTCPTCRFVVENIGPY